MKIRETYRFTQTNTRFRILEIDDSQIYYVPIDKRSYRPKTIRKADFMDSLGNGMIEKIQDPYFLLEAPTLNGRTLEIANRNWEWITELWGEYRSELLDKKTCHATIEEFARSKNCSFPTIARLLTNFYLRGMDRNAVAPGYTRCGHKGKKRELTQKPGPKTYPESPTTASLEEIFRSSYKKYYLSSESASIQSAYEDMLEHYYTEDGEINKRKAPSYQQFRRWIQKQERQERISSKYSQNTFDLNDRILKSSTRAQVTGPGDVFEIDSTILDCHIVSRSNRNKVIGRPVLYLIIDRYSRLITGMSVGINAPSWIGAVGAFENMVSDKVEYCKRFGIDIDASEWPVKNLIPYSVIGDRGEMISKNSSQLVKALKIRVINPPPYRGDLKANVERSFGTINSKIRERIDGAILKAFRSRGDKDPRDTARLNLDEITKVCIHCVLYYNKHLIHNYPLSEDQVAFSVPPRPISLWNYGVEHYLQSFTEVEATDFRIRILPGVEKRVDRKGITLKNLVYTAPDPETETWMLDHIGKRYDLAYDPLDVSEVYFRTPERNIRLILTDTFSSYKGMSYEEVKAYDELNKQQTKILQDLDLENRLDLNSNLKEINAQAPKPDPSVSKASRKKEMRENRKQERLQQRRQKPPIDSEALVFIGVDEQEPLANNYDAIQKALKESETHETS